MLAIGIKVLKNRLSSYVKLAAGGEVILVTDRNRVVAELRPPAAGTGSTIGDSVLADLVRRGWLTPAALPRGGPPPRQPTLRSKDLLAELETDRMDR